MDPNQEPPNTRLPSRYFPAKVVTVRRIQAALSTFARCSRHALYPGSLGAVASRCRQDAGHEPAHDCFKGCGGPGSISEAAAGWPAGPAGALLWAAEAEVRVEVAVVVAVVVVVRELAPAGPGS
jgi:hypothetical protein